MPTERNKTQKDTGTTGATAPGMQVSGEQIFHESDTEVNTTAISEQDVQEAFGQGSTASTQASGGAQTSNTTSQAATQVGEVLRGNTSNVKEVLSQAKETTTQAASQAFGQVQQKAGSTITEGKQTLAQGLTSFADGIRQLGDNLRNQGQQNQVVSTAANYVEPLAHQLENVAHYLERQDLRGLSRDLQGFARRNPTLFVGSAFALGLIAARFLKSSPRQELMVRNSSADFNRTDYSNTLDDDTHLRNSTKNTANTGNTGLGGTTTTNPEAAIQ
jgi:hypothetical protein